MLLLQFVGGKRMFGAAFTLQNHLQTYSETLYTSTVWKTVLHTVLFQ